MAEMAGLALGVVGLAGLYGAVIEAYGHISMVKSMDRDLEVLATRYDIRRTRLLQWGDGVALLSENAKDQDPRLHSDELGPLIARTLECIHMILTDADRLSHRYGLRLLEVAEDGTSIEPPSDHIGLLSRYRLQAFKKAYENLNRRAPRPWVHKARWVVHGAEAFRLLLSDLDSLTEDLYALVPVTTTFQRLMVREDVDNLPEDMHALKLVGEAVAGEAQLGTSYGAENGCWLDAISVKVERSEQASLYKQQVSSWLRDVASPDARQGHHNIDRPSFSTNMYNSQVSPTEGVLTAEEYQKKKKRRRELHNAVERRRRELINETIQDLRRLMPKDRVEEVVLEEKCKQYFLLPGQHDSTGTKIPLRSESTVDAISALAPFLDVDWSQYPNKGQILTSALRWVAELMSILHRKFMEEDQLRELIEEFGGIPPFERTAQDQKLLEHIAQCLADLTDHGDKAPANNDESHEMLQHEIFLQSL